MTEKQLRIYFPSLIPRYRHAQKWQCRRGYEDAPVADGSGSLKQLHFRFKARNKRAAGKRILFFSDLHYSSKVSSLAEELCAAVKKNAPDLLLCGGDICSDALSIKALPPILKKLAADVPCCATVPGNWERGKSWLPQSFWQDFMAENSWHYLCNQSLNAGEWGWIYGCDDISKGFPSLLESPPPDRENIFLVHRPDTVVAVDRESPLDPFTAVLCGHTHGGQIRFPFIGALTVPSFYGRRLACGLYEKNGSSVRMLVSTGVNHASFPLRINCRREIILIEFE